jgi:hypothetical protein
MVEVFPNPATNQLQIVNSGLPIYEIRIINVNGNDVFQCEEGLNDNKTIDISCLLPGPYLIILKNEKGTIRKKIVIQK